MTNETIMIVGDDVDDDDDQNNHNRTIDNDNAVEHPCGKLNPGGWLRHMGNAEDEDPSSQKSPLGAVRIHLVIPSLWQ